MNAKQYHYLQVLVKERNFSRASESLGISQPSLSQFIKKLEEDVGAQLFSRTGGAVTLTPAGEAYMETGRKMMELEEAFHARLDDIKGGRSGVLNMASVPLRASSLLPRAIREFRKQYPDITVRITEDRAEVLADGLARGDFDFCIGPMPEDPRMFTVEPVMSEEIVLAVPATFDVVAKLDAVGGPVSLADLADVPFVSVWERQALGRILCNLEEMADVKLFRSAVCVSVNACLAMAASDVGAAILPRDLVSAAPNLRIYPLKEQVDRREVVAYYRKNAYLKRPVQEMIRVLKMLGQA